jgi:hypothetical protein
MDRENIARIVTTSIYTVVAGLGNTNSNSNSNSKYFIHDEGNIIFLTRAHNNTGQYKDKLSLFPTIILHIIRESVRSANWPMQ